MKSILPILTFIGGCAVGVLATRSYFEKKYEDKSNEEVHAEIIRLRESLKDSTPDETTSETDISEKQETPQTFEKPDLNEYAKRRREARQAVDYNAISTPVEKKTVAQKVANGPYVIPPSEFAEDEAYTQMSMTFYADGVLETEEEAVIEDIEAYVGDALEHFGEYEDDSVYVRDENKMIEYEILMDEETYESALSRRPHPVELRR